MSWHFSRALEGAYLEANCSDGEPSAPWSSTPFAPDDSCSDKMKGTLHRSPFGTMYVPSTDARGQALLTSFRRASPARTSPVPARVLGLTGSDPACTSRWNGSLARFDRERFGWKTAQTSFITDLNECSVDLPRWGTMLDGALWELTQPAQIMRAKGSGLLPTPLASDNRDRGNVTNPSIQRRMRIGKQVSLSALFAKAPCPLCVEGMMGWPKNWTSPSSASQPLATGKRPTPLHSPGNCYTAEP